MGKGDKKTKRGKIHRGTYGKLRRKKKKSMTVADVPTKQTAKKTKGITEDVDATTDTNPKKPKASKANKKKDKNEEK